MNGILGGFLGGVTGGAKCENWASVCGMRYISAIGVMVVLAILAFVVLSYEPSKKSSRKELSERYNNLEFWVWIGIILGAVNVGGRLIDWYRSAPAEDRNIMLAANAAWTSRSRDQAAQAAAPAAAASFY